MVKAHTSNPISSMEVPATKFELFPKCPRLVEILWVAGETESDEESSSETEDLSDADDVEDAEELSNAEGKYVCNEGPPVPFTSVRLGQRFPG
jgi:hypothetical protein